MLLIPQVICNTANGNMKGKDLLEQVMVEKNQARPRLLIPCNERLKFIVFFTVLSASGWLFGTALIYLLQVKATGTMFDDGLIQGFFIGVAQWFTLRKYIPKKSWILATTIGWAISSSIYGVLLLKFEKWFGFSFISFLFLGFMQWLILRQKVKTSWIWIFIALLPVMLIDVLAAIFLPGIWFNDFLLRNNLIIIGIVRLVVLGGAPAIGLCLFHKKISIVDKLVNQQT